MALQDLTARAADFVSDARRKAGEFVFRADDPTGEVTGPRAGSQAVLVAALVVGSALAAAALRSRDPRDQSLGGSRAAPWP